MFSVFSGKLQVIGITYRHALSMYGTEFAMIFSNFSWFVLTEMVLFVGNIAIDLEGRIIFESLINIVLVKSVE